MPDLDVTTPEGRREALEQLAKLQQEHYADPHNGHQPWPGQAKHCAVCKRDAIARGAFEELGRPAPIYSAALSEEEIGQLGNAIDTLSAMAEHGPKCFAGEHESAGCLCGIDRARANADLLLRRRSSVPPRGPRAESPSRCEQPSEGGISEEERERLTRIRACHVANQLYYPDVDIVWLCDLVQRLAVPPSAPTRSKDG